MSEHPQVAMISLWRNDLERDIHKRMDMLTQKSYPRLRWIWVVGDSDDTTADVLLDYKTAERYHWGLDIEIVEHWTGVKGMDHASRLRRLSLSLNEAFDLIRPKDDYVIIHESDLESPRDLVEQFLATEKDYVAGTTWLQLDRGDLFYDIWGFRAKGKRFTNDPPYHEVYREDALFPVDSVGSCWMFPAQPIREGVRCYHAATRELCAKLREEHDAQWWVAPWIKIRQPKALWEPHQMTNAQMDAEHWR